MPSSSITSLPTAYCASLLASVHLFPVPVTSPSPAQPSPAQPSPAQLEQSVYSAYYYHLLQRYAACSAAVLGCSALYSVVHNITIKCRPAVRHHGTMCHLFTVKV